MRELYRLGKGQLYSKLAENEMQIVLSVTYQGKDDMEYGVLKPAFDKVMHKLMGQLDQHKKERKTRDETPA